MSDPAMELSVRRVSFFSRFVLIGLGAAVVFHATMAALGLTFPWTTFLFRPDDRFNDWHNSVAAAATLDPYYAATRAVSAYFPFAYEVLRIGVGWARNVSTSIYLAISLTLLSLASWSAVRFMGHVRGWQRHRQWKVFILALAGCVGCYPVLFALDRGNLDVWIACLCVIHAASLRAGDRRTEAAGAVALSLAIALKAYPLAFLALAVAERKYRIVAWALLGGLLLSLIGATALSGGIVHTLHGLQAGLAKYREIYVIGRDSLFASSDPYNAIRTVEVFRGASGAAIASRSAGLLKIYQPIAFAFAMLAAAYIVFSGAPYWLRVMATCLVAILFPNVANDYKLSLLLPGLFALLFSQAEDGAGDRLRQKAALFVVCLLLVPKSYFFINGLSVNNLLNATLLSGLIAIVAFDCRRWRTVLRRLSGRRFDTPHIEHP
ncbi:glycosyltransferase family 87 protein [Trinickia caryophylli]|uniref:DUF2029 domain-containing protein n=1 Tax=Trinickia caryophylli TaxID=28094 RepID=A0A1X7D7G0_TRICW|nr:glycosyltransferase family 87 protein [Trinickia caryophylli]PMS12641.1 DUF2029 domain-containing protein [Trinickia caryophylli]TRX15047.1 DUF2029 domain-containing protein [Trinickia caryophylli]WQE14906.1 glycosyltransferase family 87 protein [Trinickia caryophylli]SMF10290.1 Protein of unknown function [Trinickia caryophylli]GLU31369.1 hypothetical protein Busp01_12110 [Trinickia caryophylli]